jgi:hypothetical protein
MGKVLKVVKFKTASVLLALFSLIGLVATLYTELESLFISVICMIMFVFIPAYGSYGIWVKNKHAIVITLMFFIWQSVRSVNADNVMPNIAPITVSFAVGDFSNGEGYLVDFFAIFMALFLAYLLKMLITQSK